MPLADEAREMFAENIAAWFDKRNVPSDLRIKVFDPTIKPQAVVRVRDALIEWLRTRCWQAKKWEFGYPCGFLADQEEPGGDWMSLSYPNIAEILHLRNHTTVLASLKRTQKKRERERLAGTVKDVCCALRSQDSR